jgi:hypothetical protein
MILPGCTLSDALVRYSFEDPTFSSYTFDQIRGGMEKRSAAPAAKEPPKAAPAFLDQG